VATPIGRDVAQQAKALRRLRRARGSVWKGGHGLRGAECVDLLVTKQALFCAWTAPRQVDPTNTHGTGCTALSRDVARRICAQGMDLGRRRQPAPMPYLQGAIAAADGLHVRAWTRTGASISITLALV